MLSFPTVEMPAVSGYGVPYFTRYNNYLLPLSPHSSKQEEYHQTQISTRSPGPSFLITPHCSSVGRT